MSECRSISRYHGYLTLLFECSTALFIHLVGFQLAILCKRSGDTGMTTCNNISSDKIEVTKQLRIDWHNRPTRTSIFIYWQETSPCQKKIIQVLTRPQFEVLNVVISTINQSLLTDGTITSSFSVWFSSVYQFYYIALHPQTVQYYFDGMSESW